MAIWKGRRGRWITRKIGNRYKRIFIPDEKDDPMFKWRELKRDRGSHIHTGFSPKDLTPEQREKIKKFERRMDNLFKIKASVNNMQIEICHKLILIALPIK